MPGNFVDVRSRGFPETELGIAGVAEAGAEWGRRTVLAGVSRGRAVMEQATPKRPSQELSGRTRTRARLRDRITRDFTASWHPGGLGGGGTWRASFGVQSSDIRPVTHDPVYIYYAGSGNFATGVGASGSAIRSPAGNLMVFMWKGRKWFMKTIRGQRPHPGFVTAGRRAAEAEVERRIQTFLSDHI